MKLLEVVLLFILLSAIALSGYFLYLNLPGEVIDYGVLEGVIGTNSGQIEYSKSEQFYKNMRYPDKEITYTIDNSCDSTKKNNAVKAFNILEENTVLSFTQTQDGQIQILCGELPPEPFKEGHYVAGEGGPSKVIDGEVYAVILEGKVSFFRDEKCEQPIIALHEILHALGFDHNDNPSSVLYPTLNCNQKVDTEIYEDIDNLYAALSLADLKVDKVEAQKSGPYLSFDIEVSNQGLAMADGVTLTILADGDKASEFELGDIEIGTKKILNVENVKINRNAQSVDFVVDIKNEISELSKANNKIVLDLTA